MGNAVTLLISFVVLSLFCTVSNTVCYIPISIITTIFPPLEPFFKLPPQILSNVLTSINDLTAPKQ